MTLNLRRWSRPLALLAFALLALGAILFMVRAPAVAAWAALAFGAAALAGTAALNRDGLAPLLRGSAARRGTDAVVATLLFAGVLALVQATSVRRSLQVDLTRNARNTLAPQTLALLDSLDRDVSATAFFRQNSVLRAGADQLLASYARRCPRFRYQLADPDRRPELARRLGAGPDEIVLEASGAQRIARSASEEAVTNALLQLTRRGPRTVYFVTGHGERDIAATDRQGYSAVRASLESQGYSVRPLSLPGLSGVADDAVALVVAGPRRDLVDNEVDLLRRFLTGGGSLLALIDPLTELPALASLLREYRVDLLDAVVLDNLVLDAGDRSFDATVTKVRRYERHPITRGFNFVTMYPRARPVHITTDSALVGFDARYLCISDDNAWGEVDRERFETGSASRDGIDIAGPLPVAAAVQVVRAHATSRLVVVGDSDFADNTFYTVLGNSDLFLNMIAYLAEEEALISIRPRTALGDRVYVTEGQGRMVFAIALVALPLVPIVTGAVVFLRRRRL